MTTSIHFFFRNQAIELPEVGKTHLAMLFSMTRTLHNQFFVRFKTQTFGELEKLDLSVEAFEGMIRKMSANEPFKTLAIQSKYTIRGLAVLLSHTWVTAVHRRKRPRFQSHRDEAYIAYASASAFSIVDNVLYVPVITDEGEIIESEIQLNPASIKLVGKPTFLLIRRQRDNTYWVTILYERNRSFEQDYVLPEVRESGEAISKTLSTNHTNQTHAWMRSRRDRPLYKWPLEGSACRLRLKVLKLITRSQPASLPKPEAIRHDRRGYSPS